MIQLQHIITNGEKYWVEGNNKVGVYDVYKKIPQNMKFIYDKIYRTSIIRENSIEFTNNDLYAPQIFSYQYMLKSKKLEVVNNKIVHSDFKKEYTAKDQIKFSNSVVKQFKDLKVFESDNEYLLDNIKLLKEKHKNKAFYGHIDYVLPYVTATDPEWQEQYRKYKTMTDDEWAAGIARYRDNGMLKYTLRGIAKHMPWIERLHIIVASESQIPDWINRDTVNFILHEEFIPKKHLPTFNSSTIEMFLSELPGVNNAFIYGNDDMLCFKDHTPQFFFNGGKPRYYQFIRNFDPNCPGDNLRQKAFNLVLGRNDTNRVTGTQHVPEGLKLPWLKECYNKFKTELNESCTRFREDKNYNQYVFTFYQMMEKSIENVSTNAISYNVSPENIKMVMADDYSQYDFTCFNDANETTDEQWEAVIKKIDSYLPEKCKYEN